MDKFCRGKNIHRVAVAVSGALFASAGIAAETAEPDALQEVVVTATRRNDIVNKVPLTIRR